MNPSDVAFLTYWLVESMKYNLKCAVGPAPAGPTYNHLYSACFLKDPLPAMPDIYSTYLLPMAAALARAADRLNLDGTDNTVHVPGTIGFSIPQSSMKGFVSLCSVDSILMRGTAEYMIDPSLGPGVKLIFDGSIAKW